MIITYQQSIRKFIADSDYEERMALKEAGWRWNPKTKCWWTDSIEAALRLRQYADGAARRVLDTVREGRTKAVESSRAMDADIEIPVPEGLAYLPFQKAGIAYCLRVFGDREDQHVN